MLENIKFLSSVENISRATSTVIENSTTIFLPFKRIDQTDIYKKFIKNNQLLEIKTSEVDKIEIRGRLLVQRHKDILEALLSSPKKYIEKSRNFSVNITPYELTKKISRNIGKKEWILQQLKEIAECRINIYFVKENKNIDFNFGFIQNIIGEDDKKLIINFTPEYTYFLAHTSLLEYDAYVDDILLIDKKAKEWTKARRLKHGINADFIKAIVRYMLQHKGCNSQIRINKLIEKLHLSEVVSKEQIKDYLSDLRREEVQSYLKERFGIALSNNLQTITFNMLENKKRYIIKN